MTIGKGRRRGNLYFLDLGSLSLNCVVSSSVMLKTDVWHYRLGHSSAVKIRLLQNKLQFPVSLSSLESHCKICHMAKQKRLPFASYNHLSPNAFDLIHIDIWGLFSVATHAGQRYFLTIVDDHTRVT